MQAGQAKLCLLGLQIGFHSLFRCYYNGLEQSGACSDRGLAKRFPRISVEPMQEVELADEGSGLALPGHPDENSANLVSLPKSWSFSTSPQGPIGCSRKHHSDSLSSSGRGRPVPLWCQEQQESGSTRFLVIAKGTSDGRSCDTQIKARGYSMPRDVFIEYIPGLKI